MLSGGSGVRFYIAVKKKTNGGRGGGVKGKKREIKGKKRFLISFFFFCSPLVNNSR